MTNSEAVSSVLNRLILVTIKPSKVHGVGVFALRDIKEGTRLHLDDLPQVYYLPYSSFKKLYPEVRENIVSKYPRVVNNEPFAFPEARFQAYTNHSDDYNYDLKTDLSTKNIKKDEEIFENYRDIKGWEEAFPFLVK